MIWRRRKHLVPLFHERDYRCVCGEDMARQLRRKFDRYPTVYPIVGVCRLGHYCEYECAVPE